MNEQKKEIQTENNEEMEIDLGQVWKLIKKNIRMIIFSGILVAVMAILFTVFFIDKKYASTTTIYLTPKVSEQGYVDNATVTTNKSMINNYISIIKSENILSKVADELDLTSVGEIKGSLSITNDADTQIIRVTSTTKNATKSKQIAETTVNTFFNEMKEKLNITGMTILDDAKVNNSPVTPNVKKNGLMGAIVGGGLSCGYIFLRYLLDKRLRNRDEAESFLGLPVLVEIPYFSE